MNVNLETRLDLLLAGFERAETGKVRDELNLLTLMSKRRICNDFDVFVFDCLHFITMLVQGQPDLGKKL